MAPQDLATIESWRDATAGRILDAGCGPGHWTDVLSANGQRNVVGVDASARFVSSARERFPHVSLLVADLVALPISRCAAHRNCVGRRDTRVVLAHTRCAGGRPGDAG
ncbi:methyltransferase domain-containing protein [Aeromicrobium sp. CF4.19]|uniref:methyltransferase domain-containing protein n=1 Tax=Aeromicrobium sp. CF4.19 TaxID=3373082 RepID=UPI003EE63547